MTVPAQCHSTSAIVLWGADVSEPDPQTRLSALDDRIAALKKSQEGGPKKEEHYSAAQVGWRMVTELVAGLGIGLGIGYGLDALLGTLPIMMVLFTGFGFAAGVKTMLRTAQELNKDQPANTASGEED